MHLTIINDCKDENVKGRQMTRAHTLFRSTAAFVGVSDDLEAAGCLVDILDAGDGSEHVVLVNVAPRAKKSWWLSHDFPHHENGTPFCHLTVGKAHVFASVDGYTLSLVKKLGLATSVDVITYTDTAFAKSQFRSFTYLPFVAKKILDGEPLPTVPLALAHIPDAPSGKWFVDNFGNIKTTLLNREVSGQTSVRIFERDITLYPRLADIPDGEMGAAVGSSGYGDQRFVEVFIQGKSAAKELLGD